MLLKYTLVMAIYTQHLETKFKIGDIIRVHQKLIETDDTGKQKERVQIFEGTLIAINGKETNKSITVRKIGANYVGVERIWPLASPWIKKIEVKTSGQARRSKLYYTREQSAKELRKLISGKTSDQKPEDVTN